MIRAAILALLLGGCAGSAVRDQTTATDTLIATARTNGARRCAPVELAMAESHNDFAQHQLDEGNFHDARREALVAETNAQLATDAATKATEEAQAAAKSPPAPVIAPAQIAPAKDVP